MANVEEHLRRWTEAGLITSADAQRVREFEAQGAPERAAAPADQPGAIEALLYVGFAIAGAGAIFLTADNWSQLESWARIAAIAVPALLMFLAGVALRSFRDPGFHRAAALAWLATVGLVAGAVGVVNNEADVSDQRSLLFVGAVALAVAVSLWAAAPTHAQVLGIGVGAALLAAGFANSADEFSTQLLGTALLAMGIASIALAEAGMLTPRDSSRLVFSVFAVAGPYIAGLDGTVYWAEFLVFVVGAALIALAVQRSAFIFMFAGVAAIFLGLITFVFEHLSDSIGVALSLLLSGGAMIGAVLLLAALRTTMRGRRA